MSMPFDPIETASRDEIIALQLERLRWSVRHAYDNVTHYRSAFDAVGAHPDDIRSLDDLARFPLLTKHDLRANYPFGMFAVPREQVVRVHASSGTTGKPTVVGYTRNDIDTWANLVARSMRAAGTRPGDIVHVAWANECLETKDGPVLWEDHFYPEIIDPANGAVLADGESGELVGSSR